MKIIKAIKGNDDRLNETTLSDIHGILSHFVFVNFSFIHGVFNEASHGLPKCGFVSNLHLLWVDSFSGWSRSS